MNTIEFIWTPEKWDQEMNRICKCGHTLGDHAFTMHPQADNVIQLWVSQCVFCEFDRETGKFKCEGFVPA